MSRDIDAGLYASLSSQTVTPALLADFDFDSQPLYMWSGIGDLVNDGKTYIGGGNLIGISTINENQELEADGMVFTLSGIPADLIAVGFTERVRGRPCRLYLTNVGISGAVATEDGGALLTEDGGAVLLESSVVSTPYRIFTGFMDVLELDDNAETATYRLSVENALIIGNRNKVKRYTSEEQKKLYPTDSGLDFINALQDKEVVW